MRQASKKHVRHGVGKLRVCFCQSLKTYHLGAHSARAKTRFRSKMAKISQFWPDFKLKFKPPSSLRRGSQCNTNYDVWDSQQHTLRRRKSWYPNPHGASAHVSWIFFKLWKFKIAQNAQFQKITIFWLRRSPEPWFVMMLFFNKCYITNLQGLPKYCLKQVL